MNLITNFFKKYERNGYAFLDEKINSLTDKAADTEILNLSEALEKSGLADNILKK